MMYNCDSDIEQIVRAMIKDKFDCGHCEFSKVTEYRPDEYMACDKVSLQGQMVAIDRWPCSKWQWQEVVRVECKECKTQACEINVTPTVIKYRKE